MKTKIFFMSTAALLVLSFAVSRADDARLPGTKLLKWDEAELPERIMNGAHQMVERKIVEAAKDRHQFWPADGDKAEAWKKAVEENRERLRTIIGARDERLPPRIEYFGNTLERTIVCIFETYQVTQVRWPVFDGIFGEGLLVTPTKKPPVAAVVLLPDADQTPEQMLGMIKGEPDPMIARRLVASRVEVLIPALVSREKLKTDDTRLKRSDQTNREWLYRQSFHMGRHIIGFEVQKVLAAIDWLRVRRELEHLSLIRPRGTAKGSYQIGSAIKETKPKEPIGVAGHGEGALIAFYSSAIDTRIDTALVSGYFDAREDVWSEPIYRNVWSLLKRFGDAEIGSLILPRKLIVEYSDTPTIADQKGAWKTPEFAQVAREVARIRAPTGSGPPVFIHGENGTTTGPFSVDASNEFLRALEIATPAKPVDPMWDNRFAFKADERQKRMVQQIEDHVQRLVRNSEHVRDRFMLYKLMPELADSRWSTKKRHPVHDSKKFIEGVPKSRHKYGCHTRRAREHFGLRATKLHGAIRRSRLAVFAAGWSFPIATVMFFTCSRMKRLNVLGLMFR